MQPHPPQLPTDSPTRPAPKNLKKGTLPLLLFIAIAAAGIALMLPKKQADANRIPAATPAGTRQVQQAQADAYKAPTH